MLTAMLMAALEIARPRRRPDPDRMGRWVGNLIQSAGKCDKSALTRVYAHTWINWTTTETTPGPWNRP